MLFALLAVGVGANPTEVERIQSHLLTVERLLRQTKAPTAEGEAARTRNLELLNRYAQEGRFPENVTRPNTRHPFFVDHRGVPCAVAALMLGAGKGALVQRLTDTSNTLYLEQMEDPELGAWVEASGLSLDELRLIQPAYSYRPMYSDALREAAFLGDLPGVQVAASSLPVETRHTALSGALLAAARGTNVWFRVERREMIMDGRPPFRSNGVDVVRWLLAKGADPNLVDEKGRFASSWSNNVTVDELLRDAGARLTAVGQLMKAVDEKDCASLASAVERGLSSEEAASIALWSLNRGLSATCLEPLLTIPGAVRNLQHVSERQFDVLPIVRAHGGSLSGVNLCEVLGAWLLSPPSLRVRADELLAMARLLPLDPSCDALSWAIGLQNPEGVRIAAGYGLRTWVSNRWQPELLLLAIESGAAIDRGSTGSLLLRADLEPERVAELGARLLRSTERFGQATWSCRWLAQVKERRPDAVAAVYRMVPTLFSCGDPTMPERLRRP